MVETQNSILFGSRGAQMIAHTHRRSESPRKGKEPYALAFEKIVATHVFPVERVSITAVRKPHTAFESD